MTDFTANPSLPTRSRNGIWSAFTRFATGISKGLQAHNAYMALNAKSDSELAAMGLTRQDVARSAANAFLD